MSEPARQIGLYRRLTALYPRRFRDEYGGDLVALFADQLRDDGPVRTWARTTRDLAVTVPTLHLEARMHRPSHTTVATVLGVVATVAALSGVVIGHPLALLGGVALSAVAALVARWVWQADRPVREDGDGDGVARHWWRFLAAGTGVLVITFGSMATWPDADLAGQAYALAFLGIMSGLALAGLGVLLGAGHAFGTWRAGHASGPAV
jgi:hypothetical protein